MMTPAPESIIPPPAAKLLAPERKAIDSRSLLGNSDEIVIHHMGAEYRLRQTRQGKLILTK